MIATVAVNLAAVLCVGVGYVIGTCPSNSQFAQFSISECTAPLTSWRDFSPDGTIQLCNRTTAIVACVDSLIADCKGVSDDAIRRINSIIDIVNLKTSLTNACTNVETRLASATTCFASTAVNSSKVCLNEAVAEYSLNTRLLETEVRLRGFAWLEREQRKAGCLNVRVLGDCADGFLPHCGSDVKQIYFSLFTAVQIPDCDTVLSLPSVTTGGVTITGCPPTGRDAGFALQTCTLPAVSLTTFKNGLPSFLTLEDFCTKSATEMTSCLEKLITCGETNSDVALALNETTNGPGLLKFVKFACTNANLLTSQRACVKRQETKVNKCVREEHARHLEQIQSLERKAATQGLPWLQRQVPDASCRYVAQLRRCIFPFRYHCDSKVNTIYNMLLASTSSPACESSSRQTPISEDDK